MIRLSILALALSALSFTAVKSDAAPSGLPLLAKRTQTLYAGVKNRSSECLVYIDGVVITRTLGDLSTTEEKNFKINGAFDAKITEAAAAKVDVTKAPPLDYSFSAEAFRTSSSGIRETVVLSAFDGVAGQESTNSSSAAYALRDVLNAACEKN